MTHPITLRIVDEEGTSVTTEEALEYLLEAIGGEMQTLESLVTQNGPAHIQAEIRAHLDRLEAYADECESLGFEQTAETLRTHVHDLRAQTRQAIRLVHMAGRTVRGMS